MLSIQIREDTVWATAYLKDYSKPSPRQPDVDWVNIGDYVSNRLELVEKLQCFVQLILKVHLATFVGSAPSLVRAAFLQLCCLSVHLRKRGRWQ